MRPLQAQALVFFFCTLDQQDRNGRQTFSHCFLAIVSWHVMHGHTRHSHNAVPCAGRSSNTGIDALSSGIAQMISTVGVRVVELSRDKWWKLALSIIIDFIGFMSYLIPLVRVASFYP
jgi:hypothetical protein